MLIVDFLNKSSTTDHELVNIRKECSQFILESRGIPIYKNLPTTYPDIHKVKARFKKTKDNVSEVFNQAFSHKTQNIRQRAIISQTHFPMQCESLEAFYVFPKNHYQFLYSREVTNSNSDYKQVIDTLFEQFDDSQKATEIVTDLLKYTYSTQDLYEGLYANAEIIFYGIPYYYAVRVDSNIDYKQIIQ